MLEYGGGKCVDRRGGAGMSARLDWLSSHGESVLSVDLRGKSPARK
jgi:hypothetical protein